MREFSVFWRFGDFRIGSFSCEKGGKMRIFIMGEEQEKWRREVSEAEEA